MSNRLVQASDVSHFATELLDRLPAMTADEKHLGLEIYHRLAKGTPVLRSELAKAMHASEVTVAELLSHRNVKGLTYADEEGRIVGFGGLAIRKMPHRFEFSGRKLFTWYAWDSLFIPIILGVEAEVSSLPPGSRAPIRLSVSPSGVDAVRPQGAVMSFLLPSAETFQDDAIKSMAAFCHYVYFFRTGTVPRSGSGTEPAFR